MDIKRRLYNALKSKYEADYKEAAATLSVYFHNPCGIGEHPQIIEEMDKLVCKMESSSGKLKILEKFAETDQEV